MIGFLVALALAQPLDPSNPRFRSVRTGGMTATGQVAGNPVVSTTYMQVGSTYRNPNSQAAIGFGIVTTNDTTVFGNVSDSAGNAAVALSNTTAMTSGVDRYIVAFTRGAAGANVVARVFADGTYQNLATVGTAASGTGITAVYSGAVRQFVHKVTVTSAAMTAAASTDVTLAVTPSNTRIVRVTANVTQVFTGGALTAVTVQCGNTAGGTQYLLANSVFTAQNTWGDVVAEMGAGLVSATLADFGTSASGVPGAIAVQCRFTCTTANCNAATQGSVTFYVEGVSYQ